MRRNHTLFLVLFLSFFVIVGCKKKKKPELPGLTEAEKAQIGLLSQTWSIYPKFGQVSLDGREITSQFTSFKLTITSDFKYSTTGRSTTFAVWPASGSWEFAKNSDMSSDVTRIIRDDGIEINIVLINSTSLDLSFSYTNAGINPSISNGNRTESIEGNYIFSLDK